jgi:nucleoside-diphosphate-sugar epimerase
VALRGKRILITGGGGFIGSHLVERLAPENRVTVLDNGRRDALCFVPTAAWGVRHVKGDVLNAEETRGLVSEAEIVLHLAAIAGVSSYFETPIQTMEVNIIGTANVLSAAREVGVERLVNFATSEIYGPMVFRARENDFSAQGPPGDLRWTYNVSKLAGEHLAMAYHRQCGLPVTSLRPFNVYGPRQVGEGAIQIFVRQALDGLSLTVQGDGAQIRSWCYVEDVVDATLLALERHDAVGRCFNIGNPRATITVLDLACRIIALTGSSSTIEHVPQPAQSVEIRVPAIDAARSLLGYEPKIHLDEGLRRTIEWYRRHPE